MKPDEPGIEDDEPGGFIAIVGHFRRRPMREGHGNAQGEMAGARFDRASRLMNPSLHPYLYNAASSPTMAEATGRDWRPWAPEQAGGRWEPSYCRQSPIVGRGAGRTSRRISPTTLF